jgi:toxin ParE1/3/4
VSQYAISLPACRDLQDITDYFATVNVEAGEALLRSFNQKCQQIAQFPNLGRSYDDLQPGLRGLALNGYRKSAYIPCVHAWGYKPGLLTTLPERCA